MKSSLSSRLPILISQCIVIITLLMMGACSSMPGAVSGNDLSHLSLRDKRMAQKTVKVLEKAPAKASEIGQVESKRCQDSMFSEVPEEKNLLLDMKAEAYRLGANALSDVEIKHVGAMGEGCWNLYTATANMLVVE